MKDWDYIAALEKAVAKKYGDTSIVNPKSNWTVEKEQEYNEQEKCNYHYIVIEIDESQTLVSRDKIQKILIAENVLARRYFYPGCHRMEPYRSYFPHADLLLPVTEKVAKKILTLPMHPNLSDLDVNRVIKIINRYQK